MNAPGMWQLSRTTFKAAATPMSFQFKPPKDQKQYSQSFTLAEKMAIPDPMCLYMAISTNLYHVTQANVNSAKTEEFIKGMVAAIGGAVDNWAKIAVLVNVKINALIAADGKIQGPPMYPLIMKDAPKKTQQEQKYSKAIAKAVGDAWDKWAKDCKVPGLPWYPAYVAVPGPVAPPMPNIPVPLILLVSSSEAEMSVKKLEDAMKKNLGDSKANHQKTLFNALATGINTMFLAWKATTMVTNVMGMGQNPTFAPPLVPVGPVVNGSGMMIPGGFISAPSMAASVKNAGPDEIEKMQKKIKELENKAANEKKQAEQAMKKLQQDVAAAQKDA